MDNIVVLDLAKSPKDLERIPTWNAKAMKSIEFKAIASSENPPKHTAASIFDAKKNNVFSEGVHVKGWWQPEKKDSEPYIGVEFNQLEKIKMLYLSEQIRNYTIEDFIIEVMNEKGDWQAIYHGTEIGNGFRIKLSAEPIKGVRIKILKNQKGQKIKLSTFDIFK